MFSLSAVSSCWVSWFESVSEPDRTRRCRRRCLVLMWPSTRVNRRGAHRPHLFLHFLRVKCRWNPYEILSYCHIMKLAGFIWAIMKVNVETIRMKYFFIISYNQISSYMPENTPIQPPWNCGLNLYEISM